MPGPTETFAPTSTWTRRRLLTVIVGAWTGVAGGALVWKLGLEDRFVVKRWGVVEPGKIYRSGQVSAALIRPTLLNNGIQVVVQMSGADPADPDRKAEDDAIRDLGITACRCPLDGDGTGDPEQYVSAVGRVIAAVNAGQPVLVHCHAGSQRTGGVIACYRLLVQKRPPEEVVAEMEQYGWRRGRADILLHYLNRHLPTIAARLVEEGRIASVPQPFPVLQ